MSDLVQCSIENGIAILTINNPPVNALKAVKSAMRFARPWND